MVTEYAQIRRIQINELYSEHTHVITSQVKTSAPPEDPFMLLPSHLSFFFPKETTIITFIFYFFYIETDFYLSYYHNF